MQNIGTLVSSAIRPNDSLDPIASAFGNEIKGGHHGYATLAERNSLIVERREWGMFVTVYNDGVNNGTYQLTYNYVDTNLSNNSNWVVFSGGGGGSGTEWYDSVFTRTNIEPATSSVGDRYLITSVGTGAWFGNENKIAEWIGSLTWSYTTPTNGGSLRVDNEENAIYKYVGIFPTGTWVEEQIAQVRYISATGNGLTYSATTTTDIDVYSNNIIFLTNFLTNNTGSSASIIINNIGLVPIKKHNGSGVLVDVSPLDLRSGVTYQLMYDGSVFQVMIPNTLPTNVGLKYVIEPTDTITVPPYTQYWIYGDLTVQGTLNNYGEVVIANGGLVLSGGTFSNYGTVSLVSISGGGTNSFASSSTIDFIVTGPTVSAYIIPGSITASHLNSSGPATASYFLAVNNSGSFDWVVPSGTGTITGVTAGLGLTGGGPSGYISLDILTTNGLNILNTDYIGLGGTLSQNTIIYNSSYSLDIIADTGYIRLETGSSGFTSTLEISTASATIKGSNPGVISKIDIYNIDQLIGDGSSNNRIIISDDNLKGAVYNGDYSAQFTTYSLVTKGWVNSQIANATASMTASVFTSADKNFMSIATNGDGQPSGVTISYTPADGSYVAVFVNGLEFEVGNGVTLSVSCYFSGDGGATGKYFSSQEGPKVVAGDVLYWNGNFSGVDLVNNWRISLMYLK